MLEMSRLSEVRVTDAAFRCGLGAGEMRDEYGGLGKGGWRAWLRSHALPFNQ